MASAQYGQSNAQKSISTTLPRSCSSFSGAVLIQVSELLSSGAFCPTKTSSACCAHATLLVSKNASISLANIYRSPRCRLVQILSQLSVLVEPLLNVSSTVAAVIDRRYSQTLDSMVLQHPQRERGYERRESYQSGAETLSGERTGIAVREHASPTL